MSQLKVDSIVPRGGLSSGFSGGIIQAKQDIKTDTSSISVSAGSQTSALVSVAITPTSSSSKILLIGDLSGQLNDTGLFLKFFRGSTQIGMGDARGNRQRVSTHLLTDQSFLMSSCSCTFLDSPSTTSSITYSLRAGHTAPSTQTIYINFAGANDPNQTQICTGVTTLLVMEVTG
tara:strand:+ start:5353 stop:5877 length:525 start_codon:yes stop_codon:yes gene_type:complete